EPLSNLDAKLRMSMRVEIARLHRQLDATMVYVTHDQIEAMTLGQRIVVLDKGLVQQIDTPMALYEKPANVFVATFLGSPKMKLLRGELLNGDGGLRLRVQDGLELPLSPGDALRDVLRARAGKPLTVGLRPEDLRIGGDAAAALPAQVEAVEPVGNEAFVNLRCGGDEIILRQPPYDLPSPGDVIQLGHVPGRAHFFDGGSGARLGCFSAPPPRPWEILCSLATSKPGLILGLMPDQGEGHAGEFAGQGDQGLDAGQAAVQVSLVERLPGLAA